jgi:hypothetical protein
MNQKEIKLLWGRAANRCAICRVELTQDVKAHDAAFVLGEQAHIVGEKEGAPRGKSALTEEDRNSYHNIILLCPTHHTEIDKNEADWPVEKLHLTKSKHELWVRETLGDATDTKLLAKQIAVTSTIDSAVELCRLEEWKAWTSHALAPDPHWKSDLPDMIFEFRQKVAAAIWPAEFDELRRATTTFAILLHAAATTFMEHSNEDGGMYWPHKFYKAGGFNPNYDKDLQRYDAWLEECFKSIKDATRAANWFADVVRRDINPMFFAERGKFVVVEGPFMDLKYHASVPEFTQEKKDELPDALFKSVS